MMLSSVLLFLNIGGSEMILILLAALFLFGGKKLPELARGLGRGIREFKDASESIKQDINDQINNFGKDLDVSEPHTKTQTSDSYTSTSSTTTGEDDNDHVYRQPDYYGASSEETQVTSEPVHIGDKGTPDETTTSSTIDLNKKSEER